MGIRSDVGLVIKNEYLDKVENLDIIKRADERKEKGGCTLFVWKDVVWYLDNKDIKELYDTIEDIDYDDYLIRESCPEYPSGECEGNIGDFDPNPFELAVYISSNLSFGE